MDPMVRVLFRDIFLVVLGLGVFGFGCLFAVKSIGDYGWLGALAALGGATVFLFGFISIVALLWRTGCLGLV